MSRTEEEIEQYFQKYIFGFIYSDIQKCIKAKANFVVALALLSYTEFIGGLIDGTLGEKHGSTKRFKTALEYFTWNGDSNYYKNFKVMIRDSNSEHQEDIYSLFRCGLVHEYFVKANSSLIHNNPNGYFHGDIFFKIGCIDADAGIQTLPTGQLRFHTNAYFRDFKKAVYDYYHALLSDEGGLRKNFDAALDRVSDRTVIVRAS